MSCVSPRLTPRIRRKHREILNKTCVGIESVSSQFEWDLHCKPFVADNRLNCRINHGGEFYYQKTDLRLASCGMVRKDLQFFVFFIVCVYFQQIAILELTLYLPGSSSLGFCWLSFLTGSVIKIHGNEIARKFFNR